MPRKQIFIVALSLALAAVVGTVALTKTVHLGQASVKPAVSKAAIAKRAAQLNRFEASLRAQLRRTPPAVPKVSPVLAPAPTLAPAAVATPAASAPVPAAAQRVVYVRPAPIIIHKHRAGGEHEGSDQSDGGGGAGGGDD